MKIANDRELFSLGRLSALYQVSPRMVEAALDSIEAEPALSLNGLRYFAVSDDTDRQLRDLFAELAATRKANNEINAGAKWTPSLPIPENYKPIFPKAVPADDSGDGGSAGEAVR